MVIAVNSCMLLSPISLKTREEYTWRPWDLPLFRAHTAFLSPFSHATFTTLPCTTFPFTCVYKGDKCHISDLYLGNNVIRYQIHWHLHKFIKCNNTICSELIFIAKRPASNDIMSENWSIRYNRSRYYTRTTASLVWKWANDSRLPFLPKSECVMVYLFRIDIFEIRWFYSTKICSVSLTNLSTKLIKNEKKECHAPKKKKKVVMD